MTTNDLRALYSDCRNALRSGLPVDRRDVAMRVHGAAPEIVAAFEALLRIDVAALVACAIEDARRMDAANASLRAAAIRRHAKASEINARREIARLARETAATVIDF